MSSESQAFMKLWEVLVRFWREWQMTVLGWLWVSPENQARCLAFSALDHGGARSLGRELA